MTARPFSSFAKNGEDVVLWRALQHVENGRYLDVGANHPTDDSVTRAFYDAGWRGIAVAPVPYYAELFRLERPEDLLVEAVVTGRSGKTDVVTTTVDDLLADAGWEGLDLHFVSIGTEGPQASVLAGFDLSRWRPWVLVIKATVPDRVDETQRAWEDVVTQAGYRFCLFDGLSLFYVAEERQAELAPKLSYGACILDNYSTVAWRRLAGEAEANRVEFADAAEDAIQWRSAALTGWTDALAASAGMSDDADRLQREIDAIHATLSWRVTKPLRSVREGVSHPPLRSMTESLRTLTEPTTVRVDPLVARGALAQRLRAAAAVLVEHELPIAQTDPARDAAVVLELLVRLVHHEPTSDRVWLLLAAISSCLPTSDDVQAAVRQFELSSPSAVALWLLDVCMRAAQNGSPTRTMVLTGQVVVDVDHSARSDLHTGIQQVVRNTVPLWAADHDISLVAWSGGTALRSLNRTERERVMRSGTGGDAAVIAPGAEALVVPWRTTVILAEVPPASAAQRLAALARFSGNRLAAIGYDCIPIVSADLVPIEEPNRFARYLSAIKYAHRIAAISVSATVEFRGFAAALATQGLCGPTVVECRLPSEAITRLPQPETDPAALPLVVAIGSFEPRKNHLALLHAAERLWSEGAHFQLRLIGGSGWGKEIPQRVRQLQLQGRPLTIERRVSTDELTLALQTARFSVFASLHEGYGLPVAESIALGTPVITSDYGSTKEIGEGRGALLIDPRDDEALVAAMRLLLHDDDRLAELGRETTRRSTRSWSDYARETWLYLTDTDTDMTTDAYADTESPISESIGRSNRAVGAGRA